MDTKNGTQTVLAEFVENVSRNDTLKFSPPTSFAKGKDACILLFFMYFFWKLLMALFVVGGQKVHVFLLSAQKSYKKAETLYYDLHPPPFSNRAER